MGAGQSWTTDQDRRIIAEFERRIRPEPDGSIFVSGQNSDYQLETDIVFAHPAIPRAQMVSAQYRFNLSDAVDGPCLCIISDARRDVPVDNTVLCARGLFWWDMAHKQRCRLDYADLDVALPVPDFPARGLKLLTRHEGVEHLVKMYAHDALLDALAGFLCASARLVLEGLVDPNNATLDELLTLPMMTPALAERLLEKRRELNGFRSLTHVGEILGFHPQELGAWDGRVSLHPYKPELRKGRRVDY